MLERELEDVHKQNMALARTAAQHEAEACSLRARLRAADLEASALAAKIDSIAAESASPPAVAENAQLRAQIAELQLEIDALRAEWRAEHEGKMQACSALSASVARAEEEAIAVGNLSSELVHAREEGAALQRELEMLREQLYRQGNELRAVSSSPPPSKHTHTHMHAHTTGHTRLLTTRAACDGAMLSALSLLRASQT